MKKLTLPKGTTGFYNDKNEWICTGSQIGRRNILPGMKTNSTHLLIATLNYYRTAAKNETNPVIKAHYEKQVEELTRKIDAREGTHTVTQARVDSAMSFLERLNATGTL